MANTKKDPQKIEMIFHGGYVEYPLPEGITRKITSGKWGTPMPSSHRYIIVNPASRKKK